jgi:hypothetical protein
VKEKKMEELRELYNGELVLITEKESLPSWAIAGLVHDFVVGEKLNLNKRLYPSSILKREINRKNEELKKSKVMGQLDHPASISTNLDKASHVLASLHFDEKTKKGTAISYILNTPGGKTLLTLLRAGLRLGSSMRGTGTVVDNIVSSDYSLSTIDVVQSPSFGDDATISAENVFESANNLLENREKITPMKFMEEARQAGADPSVYAERLNKTIDEREVNKVNGLSEDERRFAISEAMACGADVSTEEGRQRAFKIYAHHSKVVEEEEKSIEEVARQFLALWEQENSGTAPSLESVKKIVVLERKKKAEEEAKRGRIRTYTNEILLAGPARKLTAEELRLREIDRKYSKKD